MAKLGRNDPCHCGSGRKYKQCHQREDAAREKARGELKTLAAWSTYYARNLRESVPAPDAGDVAQRWFVQPPADPLQDVAFRDHLYYDGDAPVAAGTIDGEAPSGDYEKLRDALVASRLSLHWVTECKPGKGVRLLDKLTGSERWIPGAEIATQLEPLEVVLARILVIGDRACLAEGWRRLSFHHRKAAIEDLNAQIEAAGVDLDDSDARAGWVSQNAPAIAQRAARAGLR